MVNYLEKISTFLNQLLLWVGGITLVGMVLLTCSNIFLRLVWVPLKGTYEIMGFFSAIVAAFALGYTQVKRGHVGIDIVVSRFPKKIQKILHGVNYFICMFFFIVAGWQIVKLATTLRETGEVTETLGIVYYPFTYGVGLGCFVLALVFFVDLLKVIIKGEETQ
ncbi:MAG: TRAP transporter small permease [Deltaproteobacteria bacterium]|nr:MAG: TRAP transporter small permease [Deltaproteobacteria bacterium]